MFNLKNLFGKATNTSSTRNVGHVICPVTCKSMFEYRMDDPDSMQDAIEVMKDTWGDSNGVVKNKNILKAISSLEKRIKAINDKEVEPEDQYAAEIQRLENLIERSKPKYAEELKAILKPLKAKQAKAQAKKDNEEEPPSLKAQLYQQVKEKVTPEVAVPNFNTVTERWSAVMLCMDNHGDMVWVDTGASINLYDSIVYINHEGKQEKFLTGKMYKTAKLPDAALEGIEDSAIKHTYTYKK